MKKRILSILLTLCMVLMLCPATVFAGTPDTKYSLTVKFDHGTLRDCIGFYNCGDDYKSGDNYDITSLYDDLVDYAPYVVIKQENFTGTFDKSDRVAEFIFAMPDYSIDIEVSGYKIGNTPADCKIEKIISTIPGTEFNPEDENDLVDVVWVDADAGKTMSDTDVFQADKTYEINVTLAKKGITVLPLATVNGKMCRHCKSEAVPKTGFTVFCYMDKLSEQSQYTITYDGGEDSEGSIEAGTKNPGESFTLSSDTFTWDGYIQTGWVDKEGKRYDLGATYTEDADMTFYPYWEKLVTVTADFTTTVALGDAGEPGETTFELALLDGWGEALTEDNVTATAAVTTDGAGDYTGTLTITGPERTLWYMLSEGAFVQQVDDGEAGWTVDDTVWGLLMSQVAELSEDAAAGYAVYVVPASIDEFGNYDIDWNSIDWEDPQSTDMHFTNTYTAHAYELNHDADGHWDECAGCKDKQNEEPHKYGDWKVTKEATQTAKGEKEHTCTVCGYTETAKIDKLTAADTTDPTKDNPDTGATTSPQTGDNSHMALWIALLFVSGGALIGTTIMSKKRKRSAR